MTPLSRRGTLAYGAGQVAAGVFYAFNNVTLPLYLSLYTSNAILIGWLSSTRSFEQSIVQPVVGAWSDRTWVPRLGRRAPFFLTAMPLAAVLLFVNGLLPHDPAVLWLVVATVFAFSFLFNIGIDPYYALLADTTTPEQRGTVNGIALVLGFGGQFGLAIAAGFLLGVHPAWVFILVAATLLLGFGIVALGVRERKHLVGTERPDSIALPARIAEMRKRLLDKPQVAIGTIVTGLVVFVVVLLLADGIIAAAAGLGSGILVGLLFSLSLRKLISEDFTLGRLLRLAVLVFTALLIGVIVGGLVGGAVALVPAVITFAVAGPAPALVLAASILILVGAPLGAQVGREAGGYILGLYGEQAQPVKLLGVKFLYQFGINAAVPFITLFVVSEIGTKGWPELVGAMRFGTALGLDRIGPEGVSQLIMAWFMLVMAIAAIPCGLLGDRFGKRRIFGLGLVVLGIAALFAASAETVPQLLFYIVFLGIGNAAQTVLFFPYMTELIPASRVGEFTGLSAFAETGGVALSVLLAGELINLNLFGLHYRLVFIVTGLFILLAFGALLLIRRKHPYVRPAMGSVSQTGS